MDASFDVGKCTQALTKRRQGLNVGLEHCLQLAQASSKVAQGCECITGDCLGLHGVASVVSAANAVQLDTVSLQFLQHQQEMLIVCSLLHHATVCVCVCV